MCNARLSRHLSIFRKQFCVSFDLEHFFNLINILSFSLAYYKRPKKNWQPALRMYRGWFLIVTMIGLLGINIYGWSKAGVNHILIFELNPRDHLSFIDLLKVYVVIFQSGLASIVAGLRI